MFERFTSSFSNSSSNNRYNSRLEKRPRRRYLASLYNSLAVVKAAFQRFEQDQIKKSCYDPYQVQQLNEEFKYNPYNNSSSSEDDEEEEQQNITTKADKDMIMINKRKASELDDDDDEQEQEKKDEPVIKRIRVMASVAAENAVHTFIYGALIACDFVWSEKKYLGIARQLSNHTLTEMNESFSITSPQKNKKMRGFGVDFSPFVERPAALQLRMDAAEKNIRDVCKRAEQTIQEDVSRHKMTKCYALPLKRTFDDQNWGFVDEHDYSVKF
ncbi:hypothetical protein CU098_008851 [Rhizopus stolonifer]|uniref:Uncharacterized protein n=1 Tax=Rhizopus stolonifer TaxID=4846 RepID=A0A367J7D4_RHIST|nr:hypothetical protein CU098_008851 [Rhizopus stolonifer]